jgi:predicted Zn-dependent peptidase
MSGQSNRSEREVVTLSNGIRIITDPCPSAETLSIDVAFRVGSCDEANFPNGIAHFLEHMAFKGTERRSADAINQEIVGEGGYLNASTDQDTTRFTCLTLSDQLEKSLDVLADIASRPLLAASDIDTERGVILQELEEGQGTWATLHECYYASAYGEQDLARPIIGSDDGVKAITPDMLRAFIQQHYVTGNLAVAVAGDFDPLQVRDLVDEKFAHLPKASINPMPEFKYFGGEQGFACSCERGIVRYGFNAPSPDHPDYEAITLFTAMLGTGSNARLTRELREKRGLVYDVNNAWRTHCGMALTWFETQSHVKHIRDILQIVHDQVYECAENASETELRQTKQMLVSWERMARDNMRDRTNDAINDLFAIGALMSVEAKRAQARAIDLETMKAAARRYLAGAPTLAVHGPARGMPKLSGLKHHAAKVAA